MPIQSKLQIGKLYKLNNLINIYSNKIPDDLGVPAPFPLYLKLGDIVLITDILPLHSLYTFPFQVQILSRDQVYYVFGSAQQVMTEF
jgi:hypothetical protein